jgi:hypothetical protein
MVEDGGSGAASSSGTNTSGTTTSSGWTTPPLCEDIYSQNAGYRFDGFCIHAALASAGQEHVDCAVFDFFQPGTNGCSCDSLKGRVPVSANHQSELAIAEVERQTKTATDVSCVCEIQQLDGAENQACQDQLFLPKNPSVSGFCYVNSDTVEKLGCTDPWVLHLDGIGLTTEDESIVLLCGAAQCSPSPHAACSTDGTACEKLDDCCPGSVCSAVSHTCAPCLPTGAPLNCSTENSCCDCCGGCDTVTKTCGGQP